MLTYFGHTNSINGNWQAKGTASGAQFASIGHEADNGAIAFQMTASTVHYQYSVDDNYKLHVENVIDINNLVINTGKALWYGDQGLTVDINEQLGAWNQTPSGQINFHRYSGVEPLLAYGHPDIDKNTTTEINYQKLVHAYGSNAYGICEGDGEKFVDSANISEAVVFDLNDIAYGMNLELGKFAGNDRVVVTFLMTPPNDNDDVIVRIEEIDLTNYDPDGNGYWHCEIPDGFTKVFVSSLRSGYYDVSDNGLNTKSRDNAASEQPAETNGFTIKGVEFLTPQWNASGTVEAHSADGIEVYQWNWEALLGDKDTVHIKGVNAGDYGVREVNKADGTVTLYLQGDGTLKDNILLTAKLDPKNGEWKITQNYEFALLNDNEGLGAYRIDAIDGDGDVKTLMLGIDAKFLRFEEKLEGYYDVKNWSTDASKDNASDVLAGSDDNSLIYGKGGDDLLIGDKFVATADESALTLLQKSLIGIKTINNNTNEASEKVNLISQLIDDEMSKGTTVEEIAGSLEKIESSESGNDALFGGVGNDILFGGGGNDYLSGLGIYKMVRKARILSSQVPATISFSMTKQTK